VVLVVEEAVAMMAVHLQLQGQPILEVEVVEHQEIPLHEQVAQAVQALSFFATPAQFNISLVAQ
jgi:hypothetical protein